MIIVEVVWLDAYVSTKVTNKKAAAKNKPIITRTIGFLIGENEHGVTVVADTYPKSPKEGRTEQFMPWGMIEEYYEYEIV